MNKNQRTKKQRERLKACKDAGAGAAAASEHPDACGSEALALREPFATIDDALDLTHQLLLCLQKLSTYKHPLEVRKGKGVIAMAAVEHEDSRQIRAGSRTYFVDLDQTKEGKRYLRITESRFKGDEKERERQSLIVFAEDAQAFADAIGELVARLVDEQTE